MKRLILGMILTVAASCIADVVKTGYFAGLDLVPMQGARITQLEQDPAAVLIFAADANSVDATTKFDQWFRDPNRPRVNVYAVSIGPEDTSFEVISEILRQRELHVPAFHVRGSNLLQGRESRLLVLDKGGQIKRELNGLDFAALNAELGAPGTTAAAAGSPASTAISMDGGPVATPTPTSTSTVVEVDSSEPVYHNQQFGMTVQFPPGWNYRIARNGDGAVSKSPRGKLDLRVWAVPNTSSAGGGAGQMSPSEYIQQFTKSIGEQNQSEVNTERRFVVEDEEVKGRDYIYNYSRLLDPGNPAAGSARYRARIQVFDSNGMLKVAGAEAPIREFDAAANTVIEPFFLGFHPRIETPDGVTPPPAADARALPGASPVPTAPPATPTPAAGTPPPAQRSY
ncbi:MAG: hypothetical protein ACR2IE_10160 [Candidatus Sumerlaeaceae bacterium]